MGEYINIVIDLGISLFQLYVTYQYMTIFFQNKYRDLKMVRLAYMLQFSLSILYYFITPYPYVSALLSFTSTFFITLFYSASFTRKIISSIIVFMCGFLAEAIVALAIGISGFHLFEKVIQDNNFLNLIIELIFWAITLVIRRFKNMGVNMPVPKIFVVATIIIPVSSFFLEIMIFQQKNLDRNMAGISLICVLASNFIIIYLYDSLSKMFQDRTKAVVVQREKEYYHEQSELLKRKHDELQQFRHDIKNRMAVIQQLLKEENIESIIEYTEHIADKLNQTKMYSETGNLAIDSIINYKLSQAQEKGGNITTHISIPENLNINEDDMVVMLGNILDNAIEAIEYVLTNKYIEVKMEYEKGCLMIQVKNTYDSFVSIENAKLLTRKKEKTLHGIGLESVKAVVEKYNGLLNVEPKEQEFIVDILLYL